MRTEFYVLMIACKSAILKEQSAKYNEFEFTISLEGNITYLEVWSNTERTKGYRKIKVSKEISNTYGPRLAECMKSLIII